MTVKDLEQLYYLEKMIQHENKRLDELRASVDLHSPGFSDMPKAPGARDKLGEVVPEIVDQEEEIKHSLLEYEETKQKLLHFIRHVPNTRIRLIMMLRYIDKKTWQGVADELGGKETENSVKKTVYRYLGEKNTITGHA